ncbi:MAG: hypothetical protein ACT4PJ_16725 [Gemmatimonadaceae bacterium]
MGDATGPFGIDGEPAAKEEALGIATGSGTVTGLTGAIGALRPSHVALRRSAPRLSIAGGWATAYAFASSPRGKCTR